MLKKRSRRPSGFVTLAVALAIVSVAGAGLARGGDYVSLRGGDPNAFRPNYASRSTPLRHWRQFPLKVRFDGDAYCGRRDLRPVVIEGFDTWTRASNGVIRYTLTDDPREADVTVRFKKMSRPPRAGDRVGTTEVQYIGAQETAATIDLMIWDGMTERQISPGLRTTAAHEFGHALGIIDHSDDPDDLMFKAHRCDIDVQLSDRDLNTLKSHYAWIFAGRKAEPIAATAPKATTAGSTVEGRR